MIGIFFHSHLDLSSAIYKIGTVAIVVVLPKRQILIRYFASIVTYLVIPLYVCISLLRHLEFSQAGSSLSVSLVVTKINRQGDAQVS